MSNSSWYLRGRLKRILPLEEGETCCVPDINSRKVAALFFDKLYIEAENLDVPEEFAYCNSTLQHESESIMMGSGMQYFTDLHECFRFSDLSIEERYVDSIIRAFGLNGVNLTPVFANADGYEKLQKKGEYPVLQAAIENIPLVDNDLLSWEQILEFRKDKDSKKKYRDFRIWTRSLSNELSRSQALDIIAQKLEDYEYAINKHGLETKLGAYKSVLDWKDQLSVLAASAAAGLSGGSMWAAIAAGSIVIGKSLIYIAEHKLRGSVVNRENRELALIHQINKTFCKK